MKDNTATIVWNMEKKKYLLLRLFIILFTISVSTTTIPSGLIPVYGLFGEIKSVTVTKEADQTKHEIVSRVVQAYQRIRGVNIFNIWFELFVAIMSQILITYMVRLPRGDTFVTLKVRMDC